MRGSPTLLLSLLLPLPLLTACSDSLVGNWEGDLDNTDYFFTVLDDGLGEAEVGFAGRTGKLTFDLAWEADGSIYEVELDCKRSSIDGFPCEAYQGETKFDCEIEDDVLLCDPQVCVVCEDIELTRAD